MELEEIITLMQSEDYKDRFVAEYYQLKDRIAKLGNILEKYKNGTLHFTPSNPYRYTKLIKSYKSNFYVYFLL